MTETQLPPYPDSLSSLAFSPTSPSLLLSTSWDTSFTIHDLTHSSTPKLKQLGRGALLDGCWNSAGDKVYVGGLAKEVREIDVATGAVRVLGKSGDAVRCLEWGQDSDILIAGSWDKTLTIYSPSSPSSTPLVLQLPGKVYSMATSTTKLVVAMSGRAVWIYDIKNLGEALAKDDSAAEPEQKRESSLKFMTRNVACMPGGEGYTTTSIEGRVAVEFFDPSPAAQAKKYAFKCHRQVVDGVDTVYPVTGLAYNPVHGTFATGGSDCTVSLWDPQAKKRLRQFPKYPSPISALAFNSDGTKLAVGFSEGDSYGGTGSTGNGNGVIVRDIGDEGKGKGSKKD